MSALATEIETKRCNRCGKDIPVDRYRQRLSHGALRPAPYCPSCERAIGREYQHRRRLRRQRTPQRPPTSLTLQRLQHERERLQQNLIGPLEKPYYKHLRVAEHLDAEPLRTWLRTLLPRGATYEEQAIVLQVSERTVRNIFEKDVVTLTIADRIFTRLGRPDLLETLYPLGS